MNSPASSNSPEQRHAAAEESRPVGSAPYALSATDDAGIVVAVRSGNKAAFDRLFETYYASLCEFAIAYVGSDAMAEDCVQDVFVRLWEHCETWHVRDSVRKYLYGAVRNQALNMVRHARATERYSATVAQDPDLATAGMRRAQPDEMAEVGDFEAAVARAVERLPARRRHAYLLRWRHQFTYAEIAALMGISVKGVEMALMRAFQTLRRELAPYLE